MTSAPVEGFLSKLRNVKKSGANWSASCPCRVDDDNPSLSIKEGDDGRVLVQCHRGSPCNVNQICESMNIKLKDLYPPPSKDYKPAKKTLVATYRFTDEDGELLFEKQRFVGEDGKKTFRHLTVYHTFLLKFLGL